MNRFLLGLLLAIAIVGGIVLFRRPGPASVVSTARQNLVLITIDTLRADRLRRGFTPAMDALADAGVRFDNARTAVPLTLPAHVTIMTGLLPVAHGVRDNGVVFKPQSPPLARALRDAGYRTAAFVGAYVLDRRFGLADGFDSYDDRIRRDPNIGARLEAERRGGEVVDAALPWLAQVSGPFFLWVHLYDPHAPYEPPEEYRAGGRSAYDGEVAYADAQVGRIMEALSAKGVRESTVVVLAGDHGEGLGEHGELTHGMLAYDTTLKVPLVLTGPRLQGRSVAAPVSLADVAPSLLRRAGLTPARNASNADLFSAASPDRDVYAETQYPRTAGWHALSVLADGKWKLILSSEPELYDLPADSAEQHNVAGDHPGIVQGMTKRVTELQSVAAPAAAAVPADAAERLRALGYVSGSSAPKTSDGAPNPARVIDAWTMFEKALSEVNAGRPTEALPALTILAAKFPDAPVFQTTYGRALKDAGRPADAVAIYRRAVANVQDAALYHDLAVAARAAGNAAEAIKAEQAALALQRDNPDAMNGLGLLQAEAGHAADAARWFEAATAADPSNASYWTNLGNARRELGDLSQAEVAYKRALEADPSYADAANGLGALFVQRGKPAEAVPWFEQAVQQSPDFVEARLNLGIALQESGERDRAAAVYREILAKAPPRFARERKAAADLLGQLGSK
jgi:arylsulfatase A-like enzyme/Tfp pilus assembly protein PilF